MGWTTEEATKEDKKRQSRCRYVCTSLSREIDTRLNIMTPTSKSSSLMDSLRSQSIDRTHRFKSIEIESFRQFIHRHSSLRLEESNQAQLKLILSLIHRVHQLIQPFLEVENCFDQAKDHQTNPVSSNINLGGQDHHDDKTSVNRGTAVKAPASHHHDHPDEDRNKRKNDQAEAEEKDPDDRRLGDHHRPPLSTQSLQFLINSFPSSQPACPVSIDFLARFQSPQDLILSLKLIISTIALNHLITIDDQLKIDRPYTLATIDRLDSIPVFGSKDIKLLQSLAQTVSNWLIYHQLKSSTAIDDQVRTQYSDRKQSIQEISQDSHQVCFSGLSFHQTVRSLVRIILPPELDRLFDHHSPQDPIELKKFRALILLHPRFALHHALFQVLLIPLIAGLLRLRLDRNLSACVDHYLHRLLDLSQARIFLFTISRYCYLFKLTIPSAEPKRSVGENFETVVLRNLAGPFNQITSTFWPQRTFAISYDRRLFRR